MVTDYSAPPTSQPRRNKYPSLCLPPRRGQIPNCWRFSKEAVLGGVSNTWMGHVLVCHNGCMSLFPLSVPFPTGPFPLSHPFPLVPQVPLPCPLSSLPSLYPSEFNNLQCDPGLHIDRNDLLVQQRQSPGFPSQTLTSSNCPHVSTSMALGSCSLLLASTNDPHVRGWPLAARLEP